MSTLVFLSGPISGLSYDGASDWREYVRKRLPEPLVGFSALRGKPHLEGSQRIQTTYDDHPLTTARATTARDFNDVARCDLLFVNVLGAAEVSRGTLIEIGWAFAMRRPILIVMESSGNPHDYFMVRESASFEVTDLDEAIELVPHILLPAGGVTRLVKPR